MTAIAEKLGRRVILLRLSSKPSVFDTSSSGNSGKALIGNSANSPLSSLTSSKARKLGRASRSPIPISFEGSLITDKDGKAGEQPNAGGQFD
jgi:hypothetical protein